MYNLPEGTKPNDPEWDQPESIPCQICGGALKYNKEIDNFECLDCGLTGDNTPLLCGMCGGNDIRVTKMIKGRRAECECGCSGQFCENAESALTSWTILNS